MSQHSFTYDKVKCYGLNLPVADDLMLEKAKEFVDMLGISTLIIQEDGWKNLKSVTIFRNLKSPVKLKV